MESYGRIPRAAGTGREGAYREGVEANVRQRFKEKVGLTIVPKAVAIGELPRSEKKSTRIFDNRY